MKKNFLLIFLCIFALGFSQKKKKTKTKTVVEKETVIIYTEQEAETSKEPRVIAGFLKQNPGHARTDFFKRKLVEIILADHSSSETQPGIRPVGRPADIAKNTDTKNGKTLASNTSSPAKPERTVNYASAGSLKSTGSSKSEPSDEAKRTAAMLTHIFNNDAGKSEAYVNIRNKSGCPLVLKINGKKSYSLSVAAKSQNFILIDKGEYVLSTAICDASYSSSKKITQDIELVLNVAE